MNKQLSIFFLSLLLAICSACDNGSDDDGGTSSGGTSSAPPPDGATPAEVRLSAFSDFQCSGNWTNRDGALGLKAHTGSGACEATFPGVSGSYRIQVKVQTERDGSPPYRVSINGNVISAGNYPYATGGLACNCPASQCPDRNTMIGVGTHQLKPGDKIEFWGDQVYPCGQNHGAYAKWHEMILTP